MEYCKLGASGLEASRLGLGCMGMSGIYGPSDDAESIADETDETGRFGNVFKRRR